MSFEKVIKLRNDYLIALFSTLILPIPVMGIMHKIAANKLSNYMVLFSYIWLIKN